MSEQKRILIISHNCMNESQNNGRTLMEFFNNYTPDNVAQLFLHNGVPTAPFCEKYFCVTDFDVIRSLLKFKKTGRIVARGSMEAEGSEGESEIYKKGSQRKSYYVLARNAMWGLNTWFNSSLKKWLADFNPDVVFFFGGGYVFSMRIALKISKYLNKPLVTFWGDDYYINNAMAKGFWGPLNNRIYPRTMKKIIASSEYVCLDELMKNDYAKLFKKDGYSIYTASSIKPFADKKAEDKITMSYIGNISINRYKSLIDIAKVIVKNKLPIDFNVYTSEKREWILNNILNVDGLNYKGSVAYDEVKNVMASSDVLVHVEDFSPKSRDEVRYSFSTKIADSLSCNRCLLAYGPADVASIQFLADNACAVVATDFQTLENNMTAMCEDNSILSATAERALVVAAKYHNVEINQMALSKIINEATAK